MKTWLIQRAKFNNRDYKKGIDSILEFDYMGSSEFEWGALPKSLKNIREEINNYIYIENIVNNKTITIFCKKIHIDNINEYLTELAENKMNLKKFSAFDSYIKDDGYFKDRFDFWWDIENDLMFWKKNNEFENMFKKLI